MEGQPEIIDDAIEYAEQGLDLAQDWLLSPAAWSQFVLLVAAFLLAVFVTRRLRPWLTRVIAPAEAQDTIIAKARHFVLIFLPLLLPLLAYAFTAAGEQIVRSIFESGAVIAFGKRVFLFLAARAFVRDMVTDPFLKALGSYILVPAAALYAVGLLDPIVLWLNETVIGAGNIRFSLMSILRGLIAGSILFWLGRWSNKQSADYIKRQEMRPATRELAIKTSEIVIFGAAFLLLMNIMGINLATLAVLGGAIGVGLGFGLQKIASNFIFHLLEINHRLPAGPLQRIC